MGAGNEPGSFLLPALRIPAPGIGKTLRSKESTGAGVGRLLGLWLAAVLAIVSLIAFLPVQTHILLEQHAWVAKLHIHIKIARAINIRRSVNISDNVAMAVEHMWKRWRGTGEPVKIPLQKTVRRFPRKRIFRAVKPPIRFFRWRIRVKQLDVRAEIGGLDAMESALLAGVAWGVVGTALSQLSRLIELKPETPKVEIVPVFAGPAYRLEIDCILRYRLGQIIVVGVWLLKRLISDGEIRAWARDSWRRKGVEGGGRASDSGPDEDGHGEP